MAATGPDVEDLGDPSPDETSKRLLVRPAGDLVPRPLQLEVRDHHGRPVGRADFAWEEHRTLGEFHGRVKYGRLLKPGQGPGDAVYAEKLREDALRDLGWQVVRWTYADLTSPEVVVDRLRRAFARSAASPRGPVT